MKIDFGNTQNQTLNKLSCCVVMSAAFILFIAIIKLLAPRRLFVKTKEIKAIKTALWQFSKKSYCVLVHGPRLKSKKLTKCDSRKLKFHTKPHNNHTEKKEKKSYMKKTFSPRDPLSSACMTACCQLLVQYKFSVESNISSVVIIMRFCVKFIFKFSAITFR